MVNENFLSAAVRLRKNYLNLTSNIDFYKVRAEKTSIKLEETIKKIDKIQDDVKNVKNGKSSNDLLLEMLNILSEIEEEGKSLENYIEPLNKEIEKLSIEEKELYNQICSKHTELTEDEIVNCVRERLIKEKIY